MAHRIRKSCDYLMSHNIMILLFLTLIVLSFSSIGDTAVAGMIGLALCMAGCVQGAVTVDLWVLVPMLIYDLFSLASSWSAYGTITKGFAGTQIIFTVIYLSMAYLDQREQKCLRRLCAGWIGCTAILGTLQFVRQAQAGTVYRLGGILGAPNAFGIFLVTGWFALLACEPEGFLEHIEPFVLTALALTLSMGSFVSMAVGIFAAFLYKKRKASWKETFGYLCCILARASVGVGIGILMYIAARRTKAPWLCVPIFLYLTAMAVNWKKFVSFLRDYLTAAKGIAGFGLVVAAAAVLIRPSAAATFAERLRMMRNGLGYLWMEPLLGVGPYQWRALNLYDGDTYFNTWIIHNLFIHIGVELGLVALTAVIFIAIRHFVKKGDEMIKCGSAAFCVHNLMDTGFFFESIPALVFMTVSSPRSGGRRISDRAARLIFCICGAVFAYHLFHPKG